MPRAKRHHSEPTNKELILDDQDYSMLDKLRAEGFCLAMLPPPTPPAEQEPDLFPFLGYLGNYSQPRDFQPLPRA
jgi:hypothetical protein